MLMSGAGIHDGMAGADIEQGGVGAEILAQLRSRTLARGRTHGAATPLAPRPEPKPAAEAKLHPATRAHSTVADSRVASDGASASAPAA